MLIHVVVCCCADSLAIELCHCVFSYTMYCEWYDRDLNEVLNLGCTGPIDCIGLDSSTDSQQWATVRSGRGGGVANSRIHGKEIGVAPGGCSKRGLRDTP